MKRLENCPFCDKEVSRTLSGRAYCDSCNQSFDLFYYNDRPIEDALRARIAELETIVEKLELAGDKLTMNPSCGKIDELEHDWIEMVKWIEKYKETHNAPNN